MSMPPLAAIRVFEAVARHLSFTRAAEELAMTQAGVSYQIRILEERLGSPLFLRRPRRIELTDLGAQLAEPTSAAFDTLRDAFNQVEERQSVLTISSLVSLAGNWLAPRLDLFQAGHPELTVRLDTTDRRVEFTREDIDVAIRYGRGEWPGLETVWLMDFNFAPMLSPALIERAGVREPADLLRLPRIDPTSRAWSIWMKSAGVDFPDAEAVPRLVLGTQLHEARVAMAGQGVALLTPRFFRYELASRSLVQPFPQVSGNGASYWLVYPPGRRNRPAIRKFRAFLLDEIAKDNQQVGIGW